MTFVPIPYGQGRYAGLLSVDLPTATRRGDVFTIAVRQLTQVSATVAPSPPRPRQPKSTKRAPAKAAIVKPRSFSWRQVLGAFQYTLTMKDASELLYPEERLLASLKWRIGVMPSSSRWLPVLQRYRDLTETRVRDFGGEPGSIPPSQAGDVPTKTPTHPEQPSPGQGRFEFSGKVTAIHYDRFGDFCGFTITSEEGREHRFRGREHAVEELVRSAWTERTLVSVLVAEDDGDWPAVISLRRYQLQSLNPK